MAVLLSLLVASAAVAESDSIWHALRNRYLGLETLSGRFQEQICSELEGTCQTFEGSFVTRPPAEYRLEVTDPTRQSIVANDTVMWFHFPDENRAVRQSQGGGIPLLAFLGPVTDSLSSARIVDDTTGLLKLAVIQADTFMTAMNDLVLTLDKAGTMIAGFEFYDSWNNHYRFELSGQKWNAEVPEGAFVFAPPEGTAVEGD